MDKKMEYHPCFSATAKENYGRIHLPVAPKCNVKCIFCNRKYDCVNESRPGVTSVVLSPEQAALYCEEIISSNSWITVAGIAGPGDAFANTEKILKTLELIRDKNKHILFCISTNGLNLAPHINELKKLGVNHLTVTVNAVKTSVGSKIYSWIKTEDGLLNGEEGAARLLERQEEGIRKACEAGMAIKINSIILPGINDLHIPEIAEKTAAWGASLHNCLPVILTPESGNKKYKEPEEEMVRRVRIKSQKHLSQMRHCGRCRADAVGMLGEKNSEEVTEFLNKMEKTNIPDTNNRKNIAVASMEGLFVNMHLGDTPFFRIYDNKCGLLEKRDAPPRGNGDERWHKVSGILSDCKILLVSGIGEKPKRIIEDSGIEVHILEGLINNIIETAINNKNELSAFKKRVKQNCTGGSGCSKNTIGCL